MKITKLLSITAMSAFLLTSCLGDSESKIAGEAFAYKGVWGESYTPSLQLSNGYRIAYDGDKIFDGDCALISYSIVNPSAGVNTAEYVTVKKLYSEDEQNRINTLPEGTAELDKGDIFLTGFGAAIGGYLPNEYLADRWLFNLSTSSQIKEAVDNARVMFFFDKSNQRIGVKSNEYGQPTEWENTDKNQVVIDVRVYSTSKDGSYTEIDVAKDKTTHSFVSNLSSLRREIEYSGILDRDKAVEQKYVDSWGSHVSIIFRYYQEKEDKDKNKIHVETYVGSRETVNSATSSVFYSIAYEPLDK